VIGDIKFGENGEWAEPRLLQTQFQHIKGNGVDQFRNPATQVVLAPAAYVSGNMIYPYSAAKE
jgi:branched-chain amino acid transport system substrate-binding protein